MKVVDIVARIPKHLDLYFSDFSTILFRIYKFAGFENKRKRKRKLASMPLEVCFFSAWVPGGHWRTEEGRAAVFRRGEAPAVGEKLGKRERGLSRTSGCPWFAGRRSEAAAPRRGAAGGGLGLRRRRSGGLGRRRVGRGAPTEGGGASCGVGWARGRPEEEAPREPRDGRRKWQAAAALDAAEGSARRVEQGGEQRGREETRLRSKGREKSQARARAGWGKGARHCSARSSPWHADGSPRRACKEMAPRGEAERLHGGAKDGARGEHGAWPAALTRRRPRLGRKQGREERTERELEV